MNDLLNTYAQRGEIIVLAGAGVSAGKPSALPGWKPVNEEIVKVLAKRLETAIDRPGWVSQLLPVIGAERDADHFPPDYQAQIIEEMCGDRYFRALQSFDVDVINASHDGIAALAAAGALKAIVTTNFDRLIEKALDRRGINYCVAFDDAGYVDMQQKFSVNQGMPLPLIKIHGCVSDHLSMIDTLKQRKRGRSEHLRNCLDALQSGYWIYLGFSAGDLEVDPAYLGLVAGAKNNAGASYVTYPLNPALGKGARILMNAYSDRGEVVKAYIGDFLGEMSQELGGPSLDNIQDDGPQGRNQFEIKLEAWAEALPPAAAGLCLAAILESIGQTEPAVRILDRLVRKELYDERDTADFRSLQLHFGRLGSVWGRFFAVPNLQGTESNASFESMQSLLRLLDTEMGFAASSWLSVLYLWLNNGQQARQIAATIFVGFYDDNWQDMQPRSDEEVLDAWISAAMVSYLITDPKMIEGVFYTAEKALTLAKKCGDVVRFARVAALKCLALTMTRENVPAHLATYETELKEAERIGDGFALGIRALAHGQWLVGPGGQAHRQNVTDVSQDAARSLEFFNEAGVHFTNQSMDPWNCYLLLQQAKAYADLHDFDKAQDCSDNALRFLDRFPILTSHFFETGGQFRSMWGDVNASESFRDALDAARESGLEARYTMLLQYLKPED